MTSTKQKQKKARSVVQSRSLNPTQTGKGETKNFPIVGVGASAGGLDAFKSLVKHLPGDTGMAFVLVQHLDPTHSSSLTKIISSETRLPVVQVQDGMVLEPNFIYVMPSNADISLSGTALQLLPRSIATTPHLPIDSFFKSLAENHKINAIGVVLSGTASDGTIGLKMIKSEGGITFAQDESTAKYASMPRSAANAGGADFVLPPEQIAAELIRIGQRTKVLPVGFSDEKLARERFAEIREILLKTTGVDFRNYRPSTIERRIGRRMVLNNREKMEDYLEFLHQDKSEINALYRDIFIHVTNFFREPQKFQILRSKVFPMITRNRNLADPVRIWVAGCSSGEEVYSLAIELLEFFDAGSTEDELQIFASDISESEIQKARAGLYPKGIEKYVSATRLERFFDKADGGYKIAKSVRDLCVFARHDLTKDPPFSRMDLISCCNVLIYLEPAVQKRILTTFHHSLKPSGFLLLGRSESTTGVSDLFEPLEKKNRIFSKRMVPRVRMPLVRTAQSREREERTGSDIPGSSSFDWQHEADRVVMAKYKHAGFLIDKQMKILSFRGDVARFLEPAQGEASLELTKMVRKDLRLELRAITKSVSKQMIPVRKENIRVRVNGTENNMNVEAFPIHDPNSDQLVFLIVLEDAVDMEKMDAPRRTGRDQTPRDRLISSLERQLKQTKELSQVSIEELERLNEALSSANEELQSANEELESSNEEYENTREQLESGNEELATLNEELQNRNLELDQTNTELMETRDYAEAIIKTIREPLVVLDANLRIRSTNDAFRRMFEVSPAETDHAYFFDFNDRQWDVPNLRSQIMEILNTDAALEDFEVEQDFAKIGRRTMLLNARGVLQKKRGTPLVLLAMEDITHRKQLQEASSTMMKEIHHRIKNNLQVVTSLLSLQSRFVQDPKALEAFKESENRVRSMALIHEKLYESKQIGKISFKEYVSDLANHLFLLYGTDSKKVQLHINVQDVYLGMDQAVPCALIVNELLSNSLKYAFPSERRGWIEVGMNRQTEISAYILSVRDNGVGLPGQIDPQNVHSMGLQIVNSLTRQLEGTLEMDRRNGTGFLLTFPETES